MLFFLCRLEVGSLLTFYVVGSSIKSFIILVYSDFWMATVTLPLSAKQIIKSSDAWFLRNFCVVLYRCRMVLVCGSGGHFFILFMWFVMTLTILLRMIERCSSHIVSRWMAVSVSAIEDLTNKPSHSNTTIDKNKFNFFRNVDQFKKRNASSFRVFLCISENCWESQDFTESQTCSRVLISFKFFKENFQF